MFGDMGRRKHTFGIRNEIRTWTFENTLSCWVKVVQLAARVKPEKSRMLQWTHHQKLQHGTCCARLVVCSPDSFIIHSAISDELDHSPTGGDVHVILRKLKEKGLTCDKILVTHGHLDHILGAEEIKVCSFATGVRDVLHHDMR